MSEWIVGLSKAAEWKGEPLPAEAWAEIERALGLPVPAELRELYSFMNGAHLPPDVALVSAQPNESEPGLVEKSQEPAIGLPAEQVWVFGTKAENQTLFAVRKSDLQLAQPPDWVEPLSEDTWLFGRVAAPDDVKLYRSLEQLLTRIVPPAQTEEFGDITFARALSAVQGALDVIEEADQALDEAEKTAGAAGRARKKAAAKKRAKRPAKKKAAAKKKAKRPAEKKTAGKKKAKRPATKKAGKARRR